jgi:hypothetical protein
MSDISRELVSSHAMKAVTMQVLVFVFVNQESQKRVALTTHVYSCLQLSSLTILSFFLFNKHDVDISNS